MSVSTFSCLIIPEKNTRENELHKKNIFSEPVAKIITMVSSDRLQHKVQASRMLFIIYFSLLNIIKIIDQYFRVAQIGCIHYSNWPLVYSLNCHYYQLTKKIMSRSHLTMAINTKHSELCHGSGSGVCRRSTTLQLTESNTPEWDQQWRLLPSLPQTTLGHVK